MESENNKKSIKNFALIALSFVLSIMLSACCSYGEYDDLEYQGSRYSENALYYNAQAVRIQDCLNRIQSGTPY